MKFDSCMCVPVCDCLCPLIFFAREIFFFILKAVISSLVTDHPFKSSYNGPSYTIQLGDLVSSRERVLRKK